MTAAVTDPFRVPQFDEIPILPARLEVLEEHRGERWPADRPLLPNRVLVNGVGLWCPVDQPILVKEFVVGERDALVVVTLRLQARALTVGDATLQIPAGERTRNRYAVVAVPELRAHTEKDQIGSHEAPYVVVEGMKLALGGPVVVHPVAMDGDELLTVEVPLVCRSVVFDDRSTDVDGQQ
jgi:hypothetical protein